MVVPAECSFCPPCNQTPAWPLLMKRFSPTLREQWRLIWKLDSRVAVQNHQAWAYVRYWIGPLKALTFSSAKPTTDFTFAATLGTIMHLLSPPFFSYLSLSLSLFPTFVVLCECKVNCLGVLWIILVSQECLRLGGLQLRGKTEMSSLIFCRKWLVLYVSDLKWTLLFGIYQTFKHPMLIYLPHYSF